MGHPLFQNRVPEAAALQLAAVLAWAAECQLATLEHVSLRKSTSKADLHRHQSIADKLVFHCRDLNVQPTGLEGRFCPRLDKLLGR